MLAKLNNANFVICRSLKTLLPNPGLNLMQLRVFTQRINPEMSLLLQLLQIPSTSSNFSSTGSANSILQQYIFVFKYLLKHFHDYEFFVFLEDDLRYSPDFYMWVTFINVLLFIYEFYLCYVLLCYFYIGVEFRPHFLSFLSL